MIRVLLVDDSPLALHVMGRFLAKAPDIAVVGTAAHGRDALPLVATLQPDVICLDLHMPVMGGLEFTRQVMATCPRPILVVSVAVEPGTPGAFDLLEAGAVDVLPKPAAIDANDPRMAAELIGKIRLVAGVKVFRRGRPPPAPDAALPPIAPLVGARMVVMGASTGGPEAYRCILADLPATLALPIVCVQHIGGEFLAEMLAWLGMACRMKVKQALHAEMPAGGQVYFAPAEKHLEFDGMGRFLLSDAPPLDGHRPSVTVAMNSAAARFGSRAVGVLLTGMGRDGAAGMASIAAAGGTTIAQDEATSAVYGMPAAAVELRAARHVLPLCRIAEAIGALAAGNSAGSPEGSGKVAGNGRKR